jgi:hypothetical protein
MGTTQNFRYCVKMVLSSGLQDVMGSPWQVRSRQGSPGYGRPTHYNLYLYVKAYENSLLPGGSNAHLPSHRVVSAVIIDQDTKRAVASYGL